MACRAVIGLPNHESSSLLCMVGLDWRDGGDLRRFLLHPIVCGGVSAISALGSVVGCLVSGKLSTGLATLEVE